MMISLLVVLILIVILYFFHESYEKHQKQQKGFELAHEMSRTTGKKLLVIGDPMESNTNFLFGGYSCGDICIDITGCRCLKDDNTIIIADKIENAITNLSDNSVVIFESETLEYIDNDKIDFVIQEMERVSGGDIFSIHNLKPNKFTVIKQNGYKLFNKLIGRQTFDCHRLFTEFPPHSKYTYIKYDDIL